jgi:hypothetical protein
VRLHHPYPSRLASAVVTARGPAGGLDPRGGDRVRLQRISTPPPSVLSLGKDTRPAFQDPRHREGSARGDFAVPSRKFDRSPSLLTSTDSVRLFVPRDLFFAVSDRVPPPVDLYARVCCSCPAVRSARPRESGPEPGSGRGIRGRVPRVRPSPFAFGFFWPGYQETRLWMSCL